MVKDELDIIMKKSFFELSTEEKLSMKELFATEDEFNEIKSLFIQMEGLSSISQAPSPKLKDGLDELFYEKYPASQSNRFLALIVPKEKPFYRQPLIQFAAIILLLLWIVPMFNSPLVEETISIAENNKKENMIEDREDSQLPSGNENKVLIEEESADDVIPTPSDEPEQVFIKENNHKKNKSQTVMRSKDVQNQQENTAEIQNSVELSSIHPDGVYRGEIEKINAVSIEKQEDLLDVLTVSF